MAVNPPTGNASKLSDPPLGGWVMAEWRRQHSRPMRARNTITGWIRSGRIKGKRVGGVWLISTPPDAVPSNEEFEAMQKVQAAE
jgi:hypothetical protein